MRVLYFRSRAIQLMLLVAATLFDTTITTNQNPLEAYRSAECFAAMKHEVGRYTDVWKHTVGTQRSHEHGTRNQVWISRKFKVAFIENQKAGTRTLIHTLRRLFPDEWTYVTTKYMLSELTNDPEHGGQIFADTNITIFTFVREPFSAFKSAYEEISHRDPPHLNRKVHANSYSQVPCDQASKRISYFVDDLLHARAIGRDAFHAWPQIVKTSNTPRLDFIGRVENMESDLRDLMTLVYGKLGRVSGHQVQIEVPRLNPRTQKLREGKSHMVGKECSQFTLYTNISIETTKAICQKILSADYACFGYDAEKCGHKSDFVPPPPVHFGELKKWESHHSWIKGNA